MFRSKDDERKPKVPINCLFQGCYNSELKAEISKCKDKCYRYNQLNPNDWEAQQKLLSELLGSMGENVMQTLLEFFQKVPQLRKKVKEFVKSFRCRCFCLLVDWTY